MKLTSKRGRKVHVVDDWPFIPVHDSSPPPPELLRDDLTAEEEEVLRKTTQDLDHYDSWKPSKDFADN